MAEGKILVALSGGVDSSVAALRLRRAGHDVRVLFLGLGDHTGDVFRAHAPDLNTG